MNNIEIISLKILRRFFSKKNGSIESWRTDEYCDYKDQEGNDKILEILNGNIEKGLMISKWGTVEMQQALITYLRSYYGVKKYYVKMIRQLVPIPEYKANISLFNNAGVFPCDAETAIKFGRQALEDCKLIDILGSYIKNEKIISEYMDNIIRVNLEAFYAPWLFKNPWTKWLKGKKVVVVHPFAESIRTQYDKFRSKLFKDPEVLPEFQKLICIKAVQSQAGEKSQYTDWFEALHYMENELDKCDYDVAIIGCGGYGMSLAAHVKRQGKVAIHLAGWTQMLFGVYGERWISQQPKYSKFINQYWTRPSKSECIMNSNTIENGCYW